ncbi:MAG: TGS domain-containing protein [Sedimentisphaerales bacterium]|nr:TGS domain-containing protein [Sedimentisphaerales bacterium]
MPANLTPDYYKAEQWYREATTAEEKILALERMLAVMPKHKGTDHLKADIRRKLSALKEHEEKRHKAGGVDIFHVPRMGAGQVVLLGLPNSGKSSIVEVLTNAKVHVAQFPYATNAPVPGMMNYEGVHIQIVDMPPITADYIMPGQVGTYRNCDLIAIVVDLSADVEGQLKICLEFLEARNLLLGKRTICIGTKNDIAQEGAAEKIRQLCGDRIAVIAVSIVRGEGMGELPKLLFKELRVIRVFAKPPGEKPDMNEPFTLPEGATVLDLAGTIHRELAEKLKHARIWGTGVYEGQNVQKSHVLQDKDIVELHFG